MNGDGQRPVVVCPRDPVWLSRMLDVLPPGLRGKLTPYSGCLENRNRVSQESRVIHPVVKR